MARHARRRTLLLGAAGALAHAMTPPPARADIASADPASAGPPTGNREDFIRWMQVNRGEQPVFLAQRWERFLALRANGDVVDAPNARAFLMTPREEFVLERDMGRAYESDYLDIGFDATISGPHIVARMTSALAVQPGDKVLELGTGSGYQSAYLTNLSSSVRTIEIVRELDRRVRARYDALAVRGYAPYGSIACRHADGYEGWAEGAPFDKIIVTCGIDHVPPALLRQLKPGGVMVIPIGPLRAQHVVRVVKAVTRDRSVRTSQTDVFAGRLVRFMPMKRFEPRAA